MALPTGSILVAGAGDPALDGTFIPATGPNATYEGVTQYYDGDYYLTFNPATGVWAMNSAPNAPGNGDIYTSPDGSDTVFPVTGWVNGVAPGAIPTFTIQSPAPGAPAAPVIVNVADTNLQVEIPALLDGAASYDLQRAPDNGGVPGAWATIQAGVAPSANTSDPLHGAAPLTPGTVYWYRLVAWNEAGSTGLSTDGAAASAKTLTGAPKNLVAVAGDSNVVLTWDAVIGATGYNVYRAPHGTQSFVLLNNNPVVGTTYTDNTAVNGTAYDYVILSVDADGEGDNSDTVTATPFGPTPATPTGFTATADVSSIALAGVNDALATSVKIYRSLSATGTFSQVGSVVVTGAGNFGFVDHSCAAGVMYYYYAVAINANGASANSALASAKITLGVTTMERASVLQGIQLYPEITPGIAGAATRRFISLQGDLSPMLNTKVYKPRGTKAATAVQKGKKWTEGKVEGVFSFNEIVYLLASVFCVPVITPGADGTSHSWFFNPQTSKGDVPQTYTTENGTLAAGQGSKCAFGFFHGMTLKQNETETSVSADMTGQGFIDPVTLTQDAAELANAAIDPWNVQVNIGTDPAALVTMPTLIDLEIDLKNRWKPAFFTNGTDSFQSIVEGSPDFTAKVVTEAGSDAQALMSNLDNDTLIYLQFLATGGLIAAGQPNVNQSASIIVPFKVEKPNGRADQKDIYGATFDLVNAHVPAFGLAQATIVNTLAAL